VHTVGAQKQFGELFLGRCDELAIMYRLQSRPSAPKCILARPLFKHKSATGMEAKDCGHRLRSFCFHIREWRANRFDTPPPAEKKDHPLGLHLFWKYSVSDFGTQLFKLRGIFRSGVN